MNRPLLAATALLSTVLAAAPAGAAAPLVVGAVRDQRGSAIAGATVTAKRATGVPLQTITDAAGTFAVAADGVVSVEVRCTYCRPATTAVRAGEPVVVFVQRYEALVQDAPNGGDLANLPYAHVESAVGLRPFTLLDQSTAPFPGPRLSDRGLGAGNSLLVDDGAATYDIVAGGSPYELIPAQFETTASVRSASDAYLYGNAAAGGVVNVAPFSGDGDLQVGSTGSDAIARAQIGTDDLATALGSFSNDEESRQRADVTANLSPGPDQNVTFTAGSEQGRTFGLPPSQFAGSFSFAGATFNDAQLQNFYLSTAIDRGTELESSDGFPANVTWADSTIEVGARTNGALGVFADAGLRTSSGAYVSQAPAWLDVPQVGSLLSQTRVDAGLFASDNDYDLTAGAAAFWINYAGGANGYLLPKKAVLAVPSLRARLFPNDRWSATLEGGDSFTLPTLLEQYGNAYNEPATVEYQRNALLAATLTYTDLSRVRFSFEQASQHVSGAFPGTITSTGFSAAWQVAPQLALRAWTMHVTDTVPAYPAALPYAAPYLVAPSPTVNAFWLTYEAVGQLRFDAIYRRDLLDGAPFYHFDGDVSGPIAGALRWYAGAEDRLHRTFVDIGLRFSPL